MAEGKKKLHTVVGLQDNKASDKINEHDVVGDHTVHTGRRRRSVSMSEVGGSGIHAACHRKNCVMLMRTFPQRQRLVAASLDIYAAVEVTRRMRRT